MTVIYTENLFIFVMHMYQGDYAWIGKAENINGGNDLSVLN